MYEEIFWKLFKSDGEVEVSDIIRENDLLGNSSNWLPYGGTKNNFASFENQQSNAVPALIEKLTNSIDSMILKKCRIRGIDPKSLLEAPRSLVKAVEVFFNIPQGELGKIPVSQRREMSLDIQLIATGRKEDKGDLIIFDNAEGQNPQDFAETFLSLGKSNKNEIKFVQGKFNMGSTGAVVFCGKNRYQLIGSKLNMDIFDRDKYEDNKFGFTLVRRHPLSSQEGEQYKSTWYEYFAINKTIPSFNIDQIDLKLHKTKFKSGTIIKLFSYELPRGCRGVIRGRLYHALNQVLYKPALPFMLMDRRYDVKKDLASFYVYGNHTRLEDERRNILEIKPIYLSSEGPDIGKFNIKIFLLKENEDKSKEKESIRNYIGDYPVTFIVDGKIHGHRSKLFIKNKLKLNFLERFLMLCIDCTNLKTDFKQDIFMANRWGLKETDKLGILEDKIIEMVAKNDILISLNNEKKERLIGGSKSEKGQKLIKDMLIKNPATDNLKEFLNKIGDFQLPQTGKSSSKNNKLKKGKKRGFDKKKDNIVSKRFPSIFKIKSKINEDGKFVKGIPLGGNGKINFETDVQDDYFYRLRDKGRLEMKILGYKRGSQEQPRSNGMPKEIKDIFEVDMTSPQNHSIQVTFRPRDDICVGDEIKLNARLTSPDGDLEVIFYIRIDKKGDDKKQKNNIEKENNTSFPTLIEINKGDGDKWVNVKTDEIWPREGWDENSVIDFIEDNNEKGHLIVEAIAINLGSNVLKKFISKNKAKNEQQIKLLRDRYIAQIYLHGLFLYHSISQTKEKTEKKDDLNISELVSNCFKKYGEALIYVNFDEELLKYME